MCRCHSSLSSFVRRANDGRKVGRETWTQLFLPFFQGAAVITVALPHCIVFESDGQLFCSGTLDLQNSTQLRGVFFPSIGRVGVGQLGPLLPQQQLQSSIFPALTENNKKAESLAHNPPLCVCYTVIWTSPCLRVCMYVSICVGSGRQAGSQPPTVCCVQSSESAMAGCCKS